MRNACVLCLCIFTLTLADLVAASRTHAKRDYETQTYFVLELQPDSSQSHAQEIAHALQATLVEQVGELQGHWLLSVPSSRASNLPTQKRKRLKRSLAASIISIDQQFPRRRVKRVLPDVPTKRQGVSTYLSDIAKRFSIFDPMFTEQWHLANDEMHENSINVTGVWAQGITGDGIRVAIVDDGLDMHSDDLASNFWEEGSWDYNDHTKLPEPRLSDDQHGTRCAGEIAAAKNDACGIGIAYTAKVAGIRILSASISDADEASALNYGYQTNDIYSCSWGPPDDGKSCEAPGRLITKAMLNGVTNGRQGKGSIFVFASGNGGAVDDQCNFDGYTNSQYSITVGAVDRKGLHPFYSEACSAVMVVTYSSGSGDNIHTTDVGKRVCTARHGGTSAAAPIAAGIFALVLQVRPDLTWRDLQHLCVRTAAMVNPADPDWATTHVGRPFNHKYGYGKLDTWAIVEAAKSWELVKPQAWYESATEFATTNREGLPDHDGVPLTARGILSEITVDGEKLRDANFDRLEHVTIRVDIPHTRRGNIEVQLTSPNGIVSFLARSRRYDEASTGLKNWQFMSVKHWDENPIGKWTLRVLDRQHNGNNGSFVSWSLSLWGSSIDASRATPYKLPHDEQLHLPPSPSMEPSAQETDQDDDFPAQTTQQIVTQSATKQLPKPTEHLPEDHAAAEGHSTLKLDPSIPTSTAHEEASPSTSSSSSTSYLGSMASLLNSSNWMFAAAGTAGVFAIGLVSFVLLRRRRLSRQNYDFAPLAEDETGLQMASLESGRLLGRNSAAGQTGASSRTRDLYDAFGVGSDSEDDDEPPESRYQDKRRHSVDGGSDGSEIDEKTPSKSGTDNALFDHDDERERP